MRGRQIRQGIYIGVLAVIALWLISSIWGLAGKAMIAVREAKNAKEAYATIETRRHTLESNIESLSTERGRDATIRTTFGVALPGEEVIVVVSSATVTATTTRSWWDKLRDWF